MFIAVLGSLIPLFVGAPAPSRSPQDAAAATYDLGFDTRADRPLFAELRFEMKAELGAGSGNKAKKLIVGHESRLDFVDEPVARDQPAKGDFDVRRTFLQWQQDEVGARNKKTPHDPSLSGAQVQVSRRAGEISVELLNRLAPQEELRALSIHSSCANWVELPSGVAVGQTFDVDAKHIVNLLLDSDFVVESARAKLTLRSVDPSGEALLDGTLTALLADPKDAGRATFDGTWNVVQDTKARLPKRITWSGKNLLQVAVESVQMSGAGTFESSLSLSADAPAKRALDRKPSYRDVPRKLRDAPVSFSLPSHWYAVEPEEGVEEQLFRTTVHGFERAVTLEVRVFEVSSQDFASTVDSAVRAIKKDFRVEAERNVTCPLGKGRSFRFSVPGDGTENRVLIEFYPCGANRMLRLRLIGPSKEFEVEARAWPDTAKTFEAKE